MKLDAKKTFRGMKLNKPHWFVAAIILPTLLLFSCSLIPPSPSNEQILEAVKASNEAEEEPLELGYEEMKVPHRYPGRAHALLWNPDHSIQRNFTIEYDKQAKSFYVKSYITLTDEE